MDTGAASFVMLYALCALALIMVVPNMIAFGLSMSSGLAFIDWFYPYPQNHAHFLKHSKTIQLHVMLNGIALAGIACYFALVPATADANAHDGYFAWAFALTLSAGSLAGVRFSARNAAHGVVGTVSFAFMALASVVPAWLAALGGTDDAARRRWLARSFAALFGAGVFFRVLALTFMKWTPKKERQAAWIAIIWMSWVLPLTACEWALLDRRR